MASLWKPLWVNVVVVHNDLLASLEQSVGVRKEDPHWSWTTLNWLVKILPSCFVCAGASFSLTGCSYWIEIQYIAGWGFCVGKYILFVNVLASVSLLFLIYRLINIKYFMTTYWSATMRLQPSAYKNMWIYYTIVAVNLLQVLVTFVAFFREVF